MVVHGRWGIYECTCMYLLLPVMLVVHVHRVIVCSFTCLHSSYTQCASIVHNSCTIHIMCLHCMCWCVLCSGIHWSLPSSGETSTPWHSSRSACPGLHLHSSCAAGGLSGGPSLPPPHTVLVRPLGGRQSRGRVHRLVVAHVPANAAKRCIECHLSQGDWPMAIWEIHCTTIVPQVCISSSSSMFSNMHNTPLSKHWFVDTYIRCSLHTCIAKLKEPFIRPQHTQQRHEMSLAMHLSSTFRYVEKWSVTGSRQIVNHRVV